MRDWTEKSRRFILSEKRFEQDYCIEHGFMIDTLRDEVLEYHERQKAFSLVEVQELLLRAGFVHVDALNDLQGTPASPHQFGSFIAIKG